mmetsp:Transcript_31016/g.99028  ORF Transcript_31016/g.99028 Transcript_31016/m.99028 type:complete len:280 (+) Transcript_31016:155-994(+)
MQAAAANLRSLPLGGRARKQLLPLCRRAAGVGSWARASTRGALAMASSSGAGAPPSAARPPTKSLLDGAYTLEDSLKWSTGAVTIPEDDKARMRELSEMQGPKAWTYGEIEFAGVEALAGELGGRATTEGAVLYDLGSGLGRMVIQVALDWGVAKAVGVELSEQRHSRAVRALGQVEERLGGPLNAEMRNANLLAVDVSDCTIAYLACTCWDADFMAEVLQKLQGVGGLQWVVSTEPFAREFGLDEGSFGLHLHRVSVLPMSWDDRWEVFIYRRGGGEQ